MKRYILLLSALFAATLSAVAQRPLYIVNGVETEEIESIPPDDIENIESLPADEETIARYGEKAANGVILISLRYDKPAVFEAGTTFDEYIAGQVKWDDDEPAARIILRYTVTPEGKAVLAQELESTDNRLKRRVLKALSEAPHWHPAQKNGVAVASEGVLHIQLPQGQADAPSRRTGLALTHAAARPYHPVGLQRLVKETLHERFALPVWVSAEISEVKVNYSGHCYLELVEKGGDNGVPLAQSRAVIWRTAYSRIAGYFEAETGQRLAAGIKILAKVAVNYHELYGFSLQITDIDPAYTLGDMQRQRQQTIDCLRKGGRVGHEPRGRDARRRTAHSHRFERQCRRLPGFLQGDRQKAPTGSASRSSMRSCRVRRPRSRSLRRCAPWPTAWRSSTPWSSSAAAVRPATSTASMPTGSAPTWRSSRCRC